MQRRTAIAALLCTPVVLRGAPSQAAELAPQQLAAMLLRILAYDRNIKTRSSGKSIAVIVIYQEGNPSSESAESDVTNALEDLAGSVTVAGLRVQITALAYSGSEDLNAKLQATRPVAAGHPGRRRRHRQRSAARRRGLSLGEKFPPKSPPEVGPFATSKRQSCLLCRR